MVASTILGADGSPAITGGAPRRIPVIGGPLDGTMQVRLTDQPKMAVLVHSTESGGAVPKSSAEPPLWLAHEYRDSTWRFVGWMDGTKRIVAVDGSEAYDAICVDRKNLVDGIRNMTGALKTTSKPVEFEGMP